MASEPARVILTYDDLVTLPSDRNRYELFEGELQVTAAPYVTHQAVVTRLALRLGVHIEQHRLGYLFVAPCDVLLTETTVVEPDLLFVARGRREIISPRFIRGAPDLVVEVLSASTAQTDRQVKRQLYARYGVRNYWRLDPDRREFVGEVLANGAYQPVAFGREHQDVSCLPFSDLVISLADLWGWSELDRDEL